MGVGVSAYSDVPPAPSLCVATLCRQVHDSTIVLFTKFHDELREV